MNHKIISRSVHFIEIDAQNAGQRIDNFLANQLKGVPRGHIYKIIRKGEVRVNKGRIKQTYKLRYGDSVRIPPVQVVAKKALSAPGQSLLKLIENNILFEDDYLMAVNKPSGVAVHGGSGVSYGMIEAIRALRPEHRFWELIHRLDRDTSGCLLIAKRRSTLTSVQELMRNRETEKRYLTLLCGRVKFRQKKVAAPLLREALKKGERFVRVDKQGKDSLSYFTTLEQFPDASLMEVKIVTGRTHQIRVHSQYIGHNVAGDTKYVNFACNQRMKSLGLKRLFLHSSYLGLEHPNTGETLSINAPLSNELSSFLETLRQLGKH
jgi:23S rRNA pseudouridine955/2504/2580 synthase